MTRNRISKNELNDNLQQEINTATEHLAEIASETKLGHIKPDGTTIKVDPITGVATASSLEGSKQIAVFNIVTAQSTISGGAHNIQFDKLTNYNGGDFASIVDGSAQLEKGVYLAILHIEFTAHETGARIAMLGITNDDVNFLTYPAPPSTYPSRLTVPNFLNVTEPTKIITRAQQASGGALSITTKSSLKIVKMG